MGICLDLYVVSRRKRTGISLDLKPFFFLIADFTLITFACNTNQMAAFVTTDFLFSNLLATYPTTKSVVKLMDLNVP